MARKKEAECVAKEPEKKAEEGVLYTFRVYFSSDLEDYLQIDASHFGMDHERAYFFIGKNEQDPNRQCIAVVTKFLYISRSKVPAAELEEICEKKSEGKYKLLKDIIEKMESYNSEE